MDTNSQRRISSQAHVGHLQFPRGQRWSTQWNDNGSEPPPPAIRQYDSNERSPFDRSGFNGLRTGRFNSQFQQSKCVFRSSVLFVFNFVWIQFESNGTIQCFATTATVAFGSTYPTCLLKRTWSMQNFACSAIHSSRWSIKVNPFTLSSINYPTAWAKSNKFAVRPISWTIFFVI